MLSKKTLLLISGFVTIVLLVLNWIGTFKLCGGTEFGQCMDNAYGAILFFFPVIPLLIFSLIIYWMRNEIYETWFRFARWWVPLSMLAILVSPEYSHDWMFPVEKGTVGMFFSVSFLGISFLIVIVKFFSVRKRS